MTVHEPPLALTPEQTAMWNAAKTAVALALERLCPPSDRYFTTVLASLDPSRAWDVYLLPVPASARRVAFGGHYRVAVSADASVPPELHAFAEGCRDELTASASQELRVVDDLATAPTEIHVYTSLHNGNPLRIVLRKRERSALDGPRRPDPPRPRGTQSALALATKQRDRAVFYPTGPAGLL